MKNLLYLFVLIIICSCNNKSPETAQNITSTPNGIQGLQKSIVNMPTQATNLIFNPPHGQPGHNCAIAVGAPLRGTQPQVQQTVPANNPAVQTVTNVPQPVTGSTNQKLNPKHGEPGHRCDIAVGAPLNSKPTQVVTANVPAPQLKVQNAVAKGKNLNPAHGQPGHRCDIAVGAPLDSKPVQATPVKPVVVSTPDNKTLEAKTDLKINPAHGEPGHRCDIAVGAPLT